MILSYQEVKQYLYNAGFRGIRLDAAVKICYCESSFDTDAHNINGEDSRGLMQINIIAHPGYSHLNLYDPEVNTNIAYRIFNQRGNFSDWTCANQLGLVNPEKIYYGIALAFIGLAVYISSV